MNTDRITTIAGAVAGLLIAIGALLTLFPETQAAGAALTAAGGALVAVLGKFTNRVKLTRASDPDPEANGTTIP